MKRPILYVFLLAVAIVLTPGCESAEVAAPAPEDGSSLQNVDSSDSTTTTDTLSSNDADSGQTDTDASNGVQDGFSAGDTLEADAISIDPCEDTDCGENGACVEGDCACTGGWTGEACDTLPPGVIPWNAGPYASGIMDTVEDFILITLDGNWSLADAWTGEDSYLFIMRYTADDVAITVWESSVTELLNYAPENVHIFFGSFQNTYLDDITAMQERINAALDALPPFVSDSWEGRIHYINQPVSSFNGGLKSMIAEMGARFHFAIDRFQRWREVGSLFDWKAYFSEEPQSAWYPMYFVANESIYFNYEANTHQTILEALEAGGVEVPVWSGSDIHPGGWGSGHYSLWDIELPDSNVVAQQDTLYFQHSMSCPEHLQGKENGCNEWDYIQHVFLCDTAVGDESIPKSCDPGGEEIPAETIPCACQMPHGPTYESTRTCQEDGQSFSECSCNCNVELGRWVTPYAREGNWLTDLSPLLPLFADGGKRTLRFQGANGYAIGGSLIFANLGKADKPISAQYLWGNPHGTGFNEEYNNQHAPIAATLPEGATRAEIVAIISGHGSGTTQENCAEFCDHHHQFQVNDNAAHIKTHPKVNSWFGCMDETINGGVPNQFGTWIFGRAGWCAGMDVKLWSADITSDLSPGENTVYYQGLFQGTDYAPTYTGDGDYNPEIKMSSWLISYAPAE